MRRYLIPAIVAFTIASVQLIGTSSVYATDQTTDATLVSQQQDATDTGLPGTFSIVNYTCVQISDQKFEIKFNTEFDTPIDPGYAYEIHEYGSAPGDYSVLVKGDGVLGTEVVIQVDAVEYEDPFFELGIVAIPVGGTEVDKALVSLGTFGAPLVTTEPTIAPEQAETTAATATIAAVKPDDKDIESFTMLTDEEGEITATFQIKGDSSMMFAYSIFVVVNKDDTGKHLVSGTGKAGQPNVAPIDLSGIPNSEKYQLRLDIEYTEGKTGIGQSFTPTFAHVNTNTVSGPSGTGIRSYFIPVIATVGVCLAALFLFAKWKSKKREKAEKRGPKIKVPSYIEKEETPKRNGMD